ncbi:hypothetical protein [Lichenicola sp.]|uniref:hypothetical protein n=1 Tax=Lichenicola sp. TaxID=2804529 RepID=UPI003AFFB7EB
MKELLRVKQVSTDLDARMNEQMRLSRLRTIEMMEEAERDHQRRKQRRLHWERFKWLYRVLIGSAAVAFAASCALIGWIIGSDLAGASRASERPKVVIMIPGQASSSGGAPRLQQ